MRTNKERAAFIPAQWITVVYCTVLMLLIIVYGRPVPRLDVSSCYIRIRHILHNGSDRHRTITISCDLQIIFEGGYVGIIFARRGNLQKDCFLIKDD
ncbi:hypothetical protein CEXT_589761 [Caerostris extrusa]|uniref:Uncharacterized protein n=1 Tax=Caerostris extrusa TaxID=172846 RepID=A0AAV4NXS6_CAEEX|nr:hypothetical protein CEXT_589761 [Caerostris extrusa]